MRFLGGVLPQRHSVELKGVHIPHNKATAEQETTVMPLPSKIILPM